MSGCARIASTATLSPWTTLKTPAGTPASVQQLGQEVGRGRVLLRRLEDERVAGRDGRREHPHRDHRREVEGRDPGHDSQRLADLVDVDPARDLLGEAALEQARDAARELEVLETPGDLAQGVRGDLAVLRGQQRGDVRPVRLDQVPDPEHDVGALGERGRPPGREGRLGRRDGRVDVRARREVDVLRQTTGGRVVDRTFPARGAGHDPPADPVADPAGLGRIGAAGVGRFDLCHGLDLDGWGPLTILPAPCGRVGVPCGRVGVPLLRTRGRLRIGPGDIEPAGGRRVGASGRPVAACGQEHERHRAGHRDGDRDEPGRVEVAGHGRVPPGGRDQRPRHRPQPDRSEEQRSVPAPERPDDEDHGQDGEDRQRRDTLDGLRRAPTAGPAGATPTGPGGRYAVAHVSRLGTPCPAPVRTMVSLPAPRTNRAGAAARCSQRPIVPPRRLAT